MASIKKENITMQHQKNKKGFLSFLNQKPIAVFVLTLLFLSVGFAVVQAALTISATNITSDGSLTLTAGGSNQNVTVTPSGTGYTILNGNVGVGTTTPATLFTVATGTTSNFFNVLSSGNVGIGTTTPSNPLTVVGAANITGALTVGSCSGCGGAGSPGGSNTQIQFNNGGSFGGDANFTWASTTQLLTLTGTSTVSGKLGVATTTPSSTLDVAGDVNVTTYYRSKNVVLLFATGTNQGNTILGTGAAPSTTINATGNTIIGRNAGIAITDSGNNTVVGHFAYQAMAGQGNNSTVIGKSALIADIGVGGDTAVGSSALAGQTTGNSNTALGYFAGNVGTPITTGSNDVFIGYNAGAASATLTNAIAIGYSSVVNQSNALVLGATGSNQTNVGIGTSTPFALFTVATGTTSNFFAVLGSGKVGISTTTPGSQLTVGAGDMFVASTTAGVILQPVAGTCFRLTLSSTGAISTSSVTCP